MTVAPLEGTPGIGVGKLYSDGDFHSIVWFPADALSEATKFADDFGYVLREGVPL